MHSHWKTSKQEAARDRFTLLWGQMWAASQHSCVNIVFLLVKSPDTIEIRENEMRQMLHSYSVLLLSDVGDGPSLEES